MDSKTTYIIDRVLHWAAAFVILYMLLNMGTLVHNVDYQIKGEMLHKQDAVSTHLIQGVLLFIILIARLAWSRWFLADEHKTRVDNAKHQWLVTIIHSGFYLLLFAMLVTGFIMANNYEFPLPVLDNLVLSETGVDKQTFYRFHDIHLWIEDVLYFLIVLHVAGAFYHRR